jgi:hypothetical protein
VESAVYLKNLGGLRRRLRGGRGGEKEEKKRKKEEKGEKKGKMRTRYVTCHGGRILSTPMKARRGSEQSTT